MKLRSYRSLRRLFAALFEIAVVASLATIAGSGATHNLAGDFTVASNPNGVWSYGSKTNIAGEFTPSSYARTGTPESWEHQAGVWPAIYHNNSASSIITDGGQGVFSPDSVWLAAGENGTPRNFGVIRFTVPAGTGGTYRIETRVRSGLVGSSSSDADFHVVRNGVELLGINRPANSSNWLGYTNTLVLAAADAIDLLVGRGNDGIQPGSILTIDAWITDVITNSPPPPTPATAFDLARDFSLGSNPNGAWSYGSKTNIGGQFTSLSYARAGTPESWEFQAGVWPAIYHNNSANTIPTDGGQGAYPPGSVWLAAGENGTPRKFGVIRFMVPAGTGGTYRIESRVRSGLIGPVSSDADFHVTRNGTELFGINQPASSANWVGYSNALALTAGDTIDMLVGRGDDGNQPGSVLIIDGWITPLSTNNPPPPPPASSNLVVNGSFELGVNPGNTLPLSAIDSQTIAGWIVQSGSIDYIGTRWTAGDGFRSVDLSGTGVGSIQQVVSGLRVGGIYRLSFLLAGNPELGPTIKQVRANIGGATRDFSFDITGRSGTSMGWTVQSMDFTAAGPATTLTFTSLTDGLAGPALDGVSLVEADTPPPPTNCIPAALALLSDLIDFVGTQQSTVNIVPLLASLRAAEASLQRGNLASSIGQLHAFQNKIRAQIGRVDSTLADELIARAAAVINAANCPAALLAARGVNLPVRIESVALDAQEGSMVAFFGVSGSRYEVQLSENLVEWRTVELAVEVANGVFTFVDSEFPGVRNRFYRVITSAEMPSKTDILFFGQGAELE